MWEDVRHEITEFGFVGSLLMLMVFHLVTKRTHDANISAHDASRANISAHDAL